MIEKTAAEVVVGDATHDGYVCQEIIVDPDDGLIQFAGVGPDGARFVSPPFDPEQRMVVWNNTVHIQFRRAEINALVRKLGVEFHDDINLRAAVQKIVAVS